MAQPDPPAVDAGNAAAGPDAFAEPLGADELAEVLGRVDNPTDPLVVAGLAGTLYDTEYTGPGDAGDLDQEGAGDDD